MVTLNDVIDLDNGAHFHSVDLHIHTYGASHDVKDSTMTPEAVVDSAIAQGLSVIAITDHNTDANVQRALDYACEHYSGQVLVLPGVEVTTAHGHLLVYFAPDRVADLSKFLSRLDLVGRPGEENTRTAKSMADTIGEAERLGGICIAAHIDRDKTGFAVFAQGFQNWKKDIVTSAGLYGLECDSVESLDWFSEQDEAGSAGAERKRIFASRAMVDELKARYHLAHVQASDSHSMARFQHPDPNKPWTRIKLAELSFSAFRTALVDPTARVRACGAVPGMFPRVLAIAITGGFLHEEIYRFSDNLNCFIGGRGTGKSTAIRALAYAFGVNDEFEEYDNCPDSVTVFCQDEHGTYYRYVRTRGGEIEVKAKDDTVHDVPADAFRIEYFGQGELARVAEDPLAHPELLQEFLDRHTNLRDLAASEESLTIRLRENAARLSPLEASFGQLSAKRTALGDIEKKLKLAEEGNLREVVGTQSKLASERAVREAVEAIAGEYSRGWTLANIRRNFDQIVATAGVCTEDESSKETIAAMGTLLVETNASIKRKEQEINALLKACAATLTNLATTLKANDQRMSGEVATKLADLRARGLVTDMRGFEASLRQKTTAAAEIAAIEQRSDERKQCLEQRTQLRGELDQIRRAMTEQRKAQLKSINANLGTTIKDYTVFLKYDDSGITTQFEKFLQEKMHGTFLQDKVIEDVCSRVAPAKLADLVLSRDVDELAKLAGISIEWAGKMIDKLCYWSILFELQILGKPPKPTITVRTRSTPVREIPVIQLSDGQRHTILLTIAMLAESNVPLVIDQPEDDLDNAFIFTSIVATLRAIKERRQVILVTHNANIAVLGDSELLLPMNRVKDCGRATDRGSIDTEATKLCVQNILEGGPARIPASQRDLQPLADTRKSVSRSLLRAKS